MKYRVYTGIVELDEDSGTLFGRVTGLRDTITFQGESVAEVVRAFHDSVDDYLEFCAQGGESPEKPYSGQFVLRIDAQLHREMASTAEAQDISLNALVERALKSAFPSQPPVTGPPPQAALKTRRAGKRRPKTAKGRRRREG